MAAAEAPQSGDVMRALSLFLVFVTAKLLVLAGRDVPLSPWTPLAFFWQDGLVASQLCLVNACQLGKVDIPRRTIRNNVVTHA